LEQPNLEFTEDSRITLDVPAFVAERVAVLRLLGRRAWKAGDRYFLVRQHEHFMFAHDSCECDANKCTGCLVSSSVAAQLEGDIEKAALDPARAEKEREKARALIKLEADDWRFELNQIRDRIRAQQDFRSNAVETARAAREAMRQRTLRHDRSREAGDTP
jgi:hypothetical protein